VVERDISLNEAARLLGHSRNRLRERWPEIPTAYVEGGRYWVNPTGLREWLYERGNTGNSAAEASRASAASAR